MPRKVDQAYKTESSIFATRLREIMKKRGENQTTLAEKISAEYATIQRQTISLYMNGQSKPDIERLTALAKTLGVSADWLLGLSDVPSPDFSIAEICKKTALHEGIVQVLCANQKYASPGTTGRIFSADGLNAVFYPAHKMIYFLRSLSEYVSYVNEAKNVIRAAKQESKDCEPERDNELFEKINNSLDKVRFSRLGIVDYISEVIGEFAKANNVDDRSCGPDILHPEDITWAKYIEPRSISE